jgi:hypothetical protein
MKKIADRYLPFPRILQPWPERGSSSPSKVGARCVSSAPAAHAPHNKPSSPTQDLAEPAALPFGPFMAYGHELLLDLSKLGTHSLADWLPTEHEARAASTGRAIMLGAKRGERTCDGR